MFHITTNKTEESWSRNDIKSAKPGEDSNEILERINKLSTEGMSYETVVDFLQMQLGTWRRFYKEDDSVDVSEAWTADNKKVTRILSKNILFYVRETGANSYKVTSGFVNSIQDPCNKLFEDSGNSFEILEGAK